MGEREFTQKLGEEGHEDRGGFEENLEWVSFLAN